MNARQEVLKGAMKTTSMVEDGEHDLLEAVLIATENFSKAQGNITGRVSESAAAQSAQDKRVVLLPDSDFHEHGQLFRYIVLSAWGQFLRRILKPFGCKCCESRDQ